MSFRQNNGTVYISLIPRNMTLQTPVPVRTQLGTQYEFSFNTLERSYLLDPETVNPYGNPPTHTKQEAPKP